jgi:phosphate uptake regulator
VPALIKQLGDDDPKIREEASQKLHRMGQGALSALSEATKSSDPEVASRAQTVIRQIDEDLHPKPPVEPTADDIMNRLRVRRMQGMQQPMLQQRVQAVRVNTARSVSIKRNADGEMVKDITVTEGGRTVKIHESPDGIAIKTTVAGQDTVVEAKDKAELKKEHPAEFALYEKYSAVGGGGLEGAAAMRLDIMDAQRVNLERAKLTLEEQKLVEGQLRQAQEQMQEARKALEAQHQQIEERMRQLRKELEEPPQQQQ